MTTNRKTSEERKETLARTIASLLAQGGYRVESQSDYQAVLVRGRPVNHVLHLLISFFTAFLWVFVWLGLIVFGGEKREIVQVDEWGTPTIARL